MFCNKCGTQYKDGASFCTKCGNNLQRNMNMPVKNVEDKQVKQKKNKKWSIAVVVVLLGLGIVGAILWQSGILMGKSTDITRGYNSSTTAEEILEKEEKNKDTTLMGGYTSAERWNEEIGVYEYDMVETDNVNEMGWIGYEGGKLLGMSAENVQFTLRDSKLFTITYIFPVNDYDKVKEKISKKYEDYRIVNEYGEYWSMEDYTVDIEDYDENFGVSVTFAE